MKRFFPILFAIVLGAGATRADLPPDWSTNYDATLAAAATNQQPALVYFTASWCAPCKLMARTTLADPAVTQALSGVGHVAVDIDEHPDLASARGAGAVPTFVLVAAGGSEADRTTGFLPVADFLAWLTNGMVAAKEIARREALARQELAEADQLLAARETNADRLAAAKLFDLSALRGSDLIQAAGARLITLAGTNPSVVLEGLSDPRLAVRIQAANALRLGVGDSFDVDPWSAVDLRQQTIFKWREKLAQSSGGGKPSAQ